MLMQGQDGRWHSQQGFAAKRLKDSLHEQLASDQAFIRQPMKHVRQECTSEMRAVVQRVHGLAVRFACSVLAL